MEMYIYVLCAAGGLALGLAGAFLNMHISKRSANSQSIIAVMGTNMLRLLTDAAVLSAVFFGCRALDLPYITALVAAALGLSVGGVILLSKLSKQIKDNCQSQDGGE